MIFFNRKTLLVALHPKSMIMKKLSLIIMLLCGTWFAKAQVFWFENWTSCSCDSLCTSYTGPNGAWAITNIGTQGAAANVWYFSYKEQGLGRNACGSAIGTRASAHVGNVSASPNAALLCPYGDCGALNDDAPSTTFTKTRLESPVINCTGKSHITLSFNYILKGDTAHDYATVWYFNGTAWTQINKPAQTPPICPGFPVSPGLWTYDTISLPSSADNNPNVKIGFLWYNDTSATADNNLDYPSFAIDSIALSSSVPMGISSMNAGNGVVSLYPNPNNGVFQIAGSQQLLANSQIEIYNMLGEKVYSHYQITTPSEYQIDLSSQPAGIYLFRVITETGYLIGEGKFEIIH